MIVESNHMEPVARQHPAKVCRSVATGFVNRDRRSNIKLRSSRRNSPFARIPARRDSGGSYCNPAVFTHVFVVQAGCERDWNAQFTTVCPAAVYPLVMALQVKVARKRLVTGDTRLVTVGELYVKPNT